MRLVWQLLLDGCACPRAMPPNESMVCCRASPHQTKCMQADFVYTVTLALLPSLNQLQGLFANSDESPLFDSISLPIKDSVQDPLRPWGYEFQREGLAPSRSRRHRSVYSSFFISIVLLQLLLRSGSARPPCKSAALSLSTKTTLNT